MFEVRLPRDATVGTARLGMVVARDFAALPLSGVRASFLRLGKAKM